LGNLLRVEKSTYYSGTLTPVSFRDNPSSKGFLNCVQGDVHTVSTLLCAQRSSILILSKYCQEDEIMKDE
jgi:hypothetical protein